MDSQKPKPRHKAQTRSQACRNQSKFLNAKTKRCCIKPPPHGRRRKKKSDTKKRKCATATPAPSRTSATSEWEMSNTQLGEAGKEGTVILVRRKGAAKGAADEFAAMKVFKKSKSAKMVVKEAEFQRKAALAGAAPAVLAVIRKAPPRIVMERMDRTVLDVLHDQKGMLTDAQQRAILRLYALLDGVGVLHNDSNPANLMVRGHGNSEEWRLIDFGFSKNTQKAHGTSPNMRLSLRFLLNGRLGLIARSRLTTPPTLLLEALQAANKAHTARK